MGRPTKYNKKIVDKIYTLIASDTYTVEEICRMVKIATSTYFDCVNKYRDFSDNIKKAEEARTETLAMEAERSLKKLVTGYTVEETQITSVGTGKYDVNGKEIAKVKEQRTTKKHFQPNPAAVFFTLCNAEPDKWKNRQVAELTGKDGKDLFGKLTDEELDAKIAELERKNKQ